MKKIILNSILIFLMISMLLSSFHFYFAKKNEKKEFVEKVQTNLNEHNSSEIINNSKKKNEKESVHKVCSNIYRKMKKTISKHHNSLITLKLKNDYFKKFDVNKYNKSIESIINNDLFQESEQIKNIFMDLINITKNKQKKSSISKAKKNLFQEKKKTMSLNEKLDFIENRCKEKQFAASFKESAIATMQEHMVRINYSNTIV